MRKIRKLAAVTVLASFLLGAPNHLLAAFQCGADLNGDGYVDQEEEIAACAEAKDCESGEAALFCPVAVADCTGSWKEGFTCPLGDYPCLETGEGVPQCSPHACVDTAAAENIINHLPESDPVYQDDGELDENGNCLGEIFIFSGKATRCRPPGLTVGYANDCCDSSEPMLSDPKTGSRVRTAVGAVTTLYEMAQVGYYSYQIAQGAMAAVQVGGQVVVYNAGGAIAATYASGSAVGAGVMSASATASAAGATIAGSGAAAAGGATATVSSGLTAYAGALFNPATIIIAIVVMVVMKVLMGNGCSAQDIETAIYANSDYCRYLGTVCEKEIELMGCVQKAKRYCCFNSKMARIVQEQGRPQLKSFGPDGGWGTPENPNCRGFTPVEFQQLDFARIDLSEYFGDIEEDLNEKIQAAQQTVQEKIGQHYEQIR